MINNQIKMYPYLRWAGGKRQIIRKLIAALPGDINERSFFEPFVGAGALFFAYGPKRAVLSDANEHLIQSYYYVREQPDLIHNYLLDHKRLNSEQYYYGIRDIYNNSGYSAAQASRFIYLNKACFNGIFRVNSKGAFNVPYGFKEPPSLPSLAELRLASLLLETAKIKTSSFECAVADCGKNDFVYIDPPYPPLNGTSYFTHYTAGRFGEREQSRVAEVVLSLDKIGAKVMVTNADTTLIRKLYRRLNIKTVDVTRFVTCKAIKHIVGELIITNY